MTREQAEVLWEAAALAYARTFASDKSLLVAQDRAEACAAFATALVKQHHRAFPAIDAGSLTEEEKALARVMPINAIKSYRNRTGAALGEAKKVIDAYRDTLGSE